MEESPVAADAALAAVAQPSKTYRVRVDAAGRIVLPAELRSALSIRGGDVVLLRQERGGLRVESFARALAEARDFFARHTVGNREERDEDRDR